MSVEELRRRMEEWQPAAYDALPDIDLYKDQVLSYMQRQQLTGAGADELTGAMINNYIKSGLLPRPSGKRYQRQHLAALTAICQLKQVLSVGDTSALLSAQPDLADTASFYTRYVARLGEALHRAAAQLPEQDDRDALARCALELAVQSYASQLAAREMLGLLAAAPAAGEEPEQGKEKKNQR